MTNENKKATNDMAAAEILNQSAKGEIILYKAQDDDITIDVLVENETVWLSQAQMVMLFGRDQSVISKHISNIFKEGELNRNSVYAKFAYTAADGKTYFVDYYNLDVIISVGYRIKSQRGTEFRIWATKTLRDYILKGYVINQRIDRLERKVVEYDQKFELLVRTALPPKEGIFYDGQIFDAYIFVSDLIKSATKTVVLIDNWLDESVLLLLSKRKNGVKATIYTKEISNTLQLDLQRYNAQYPQIFIEEKSNIHDRFLLIDSELYNIGASIKDLGKKLFAFNKMEMTANELLKNITARKGIKQ